jgi:hypothetical protein
MGIDIGYTEESLVECKYALCRPYRRKIKGFYADIPDGVDDLADYRHVERYVNMLHLSYEEPMLYRRILNETRCNETRDLWPWNDYWFGDFYKDRRTARQLKPYLETKPSGRVLFNKMPKYLRDEWMKKPDDGQFITAWWDLPVEKHIEVCQPCPIRPLDEVNCYMRFSNYPGMNSFRAGFLLTALYSATLDKEKLEGAYFSFPHVEKGQGQLPADKIGELFEMCQGSPINKGAEVFFNNVVDVIDQAIPDDAESSAEKINLEEAPFVDEFLSKYIYREEPYTQEEIKEALPYFETLREIADWAIFDADAKPARVHMISFRDSFNSLITALQIGQKYGLDPYVSY